MSTTPPSSASETEKYIEVEGIKIRLEDLFRAPEKDGAVVSVRVHRSVKEALARLAEKEGLHGVSELIRYIIAGFLMGKYKVEKPNPKVLAPPIYLNVNVQIARKNTAEEERRQQHEDIARLEAKSEIDEVIREVEDFLEKVRTKQVRVAGNDYIRKLRAKVFRAMVKALKHDLTDELVKLRQLFEELNNLILNTFRGLV